jgi:transposase InsO family protein
MVCRVLDKPRSWLYYRRRPERARSLKQLAIEAAIRRLRGTSPASYGYRRIHALLTRHGLRCNPKTVW